MVEDRIGYRYAKSIYKLAVDKDLVDKARADMGMIHDVCQRNKDLVNLLRSPLVNPGKKQRILSEIFDKHYQTELTKMLVEMIVRKGREMYLPQVASAFLEIYDAENAILRGVLTSAVPLTPSQPASIQQAITEQTGKSFELITEVNPDLIGGFVLKVGDRLFDGSVSSSLRKIKQAFEKP